MVSRVRSLEGYSSHQYVWLCFCLYFSLSQSACPSNAVTMLWGSPGLIEGSCGGVSATAPAKVSDGKPQGSDLQVTEPLHNFSTWLIPGRAGMSSPCPTMLRLQLWEQENFVIFFKLLSSGLIFMFLDFSFYQSCFLKNVHWSLTYIQWNAQVGSV